MNEEFEFESESIASVNQKESSDQQQFQKYHQQQMKQNNSDFQREKQINTIQFQYLKNNVKEQFQTETKKNNYFNQNRISKNQMIQQKLQNKQIVKQQQLQNKVDEMWVKKEKKQKKIRSNIEQFEQKAMQKKVRKYHYNLIKECYERIKVQQQIKQQNELKLQQPIITFNKETRTFPSSDFLYKKFKSNGQFMKALQSFQNIMFEQISMQQNEIQKNVNRGFLRYYVLQTKASNKKMFKTWRCTFAHCNSIMKCTDSVTQFQMYLLRNNHSHTIQGKLVIQNQDHQKPQPREQIIFNQQLHQMFGLHKGAFTETRNLKYIQPQRKKQLRRERQRILRQQKLKQQGHLIDQKQKQKPVKKRKRNLHGQPRSMPPLGKIPPIERLMIQMKEIQQFLKQKDVQSSHTQHFFMFVTKGMKQQFQKFPQTARIQTSKLPFRLSRKRYPFHNFQLGCFYGLNCYLRSVIYAIFIFASGLSYDIFKAFQFLVGKPNLYIIQKKKLSMMEKKQQRDIPFNYFCDIDSTLQTLTQVLSDIKNEKYLRRLFCSPSKIQFRAMKDKLYNKEQHKVLQLLETSSIVSNLDNKFTGMNILLNQPPLALEQCLIYTLRLGVQCLLQTSIKAMAHSKGDLRETVEVELTHNDAELKAVRMNVAPQVLNVFYQQYCIMGNIGKEGRIQIKQDKCSCRFTQMFGIPCTHLIYKAKTTKVSDISQSLDFASCYALHHILIQNLIVVMGNEQKFMYQGEKQEEWERREKQSQTSHETSINQGQSVKQEEQLYYEKMLFHTWKEENQEEIKITEKQVMQQDQKREKEETKFSKKKIVLPPLNHQVIIQNEKIHQINFQKLHNIEKQNKKLKPIQQKEIYQQQKIQKNYTDVLLPIIQLKQKQKQTQNKLKQKLKLIPIQNKRQSFNVALSIIVDIALKVEKQIQIKELNKMNIFLENSQKNKIVSKESYMQKQFIQLTYKKQSFQHQLKQTLKTVQPQKQAQLNQKCQEVQPIQNPIESQVIQKAFHQQQIKYVNKECDCKNLNPQIVIKSIQNQYIFLSQCSSSTIKLDEGGKYAYQTVEYYQNKKVCLTGAVRNGECAFRIDDLHYCVGVGVALRQVLHSHQYTYLSHEHGLLHGLYIVTSQGYSWSHSSLQDDDCMRLNYNQIYAGLTIKVALTTLQDGSMIVKFKSKLGEFTMDIPQSIASMYQICFCAYLHRKGDGVTIVN